MHMDTLEENYYQYNKIFSTILFVFHKLPSTDAFWVEDSFTRMSGNLL